MRIISAFAGAIIATTSFAVSHPATAQDRLPDYVRSNALIAGQLLGCAVRFDVYYRQTVERAADAGRILPPAYQLNAIAGLDVAALLSDTRQVLLAQSTEAVPIDEVETAISEIAGLEYDAAGAGTPGYHEAWSQVAGCGALFRQFGLYELY
jgi:hypothetical protein